MIQQGRIRFVVLLFLSLFYFVPKGYALGVDFIERTSFNEDGSGLFSIQVDFTKSNTLLSVIEYLNQDCKDSYKCIGYNTFCIAKDILKHIDGIYGVSVHSKNMLKVVLRFRFKNIQALNLAMQTMNQGIDPGEITYFNLNNELFVREDMNGIAKKLVFYDQCDHLLVKSLDLAYFFQGTTYTTIYTFDKKISAFTNPLGELTKDKKTICIMHHLLSGDETKESIGNRIHFEK